MTFARKLLTISALVISIWLVVGVLIYRSSSFSLFSDTPDFVISESEPFKEELEACKDRGQKLSPMFWKNVNFHRREIPESIQKVSSSEIVVISNFTMIQDSKVHYLWASPQERKSLSVLLLHGQNFKAETWNKLHTLEYIAAFGFYVVAVDLPGFGKSAINPNLSKTAFLHSIISTLDLKNVVIISPSMSGAYSIPYLMSPSISRVAGFVPVSPVSTNTLKLSPCKEEANFSKVHFDKDCHKVLPYLKRDPPKLNCIKVPTLVVFGEQDKGKNSARLCLLPNSQGAEVPLGKHAAYLSHPKYWHTLLYNFLNVLDDTLPCT